MKLNVKVKEISLSRNPFGSSLEEMMNKFLINHPFQSFSTYFFDLINNFILFLSLLHFSPCLLGLSGLQIFKLTPKPNRDWFGYDRLIESEMSNRPITNPLHFSINKETTNLSIFLTNNVHRYLGKECELVSNFICIKHTVWSLSTRKASSH